MKTTPPNASTPPTGRTSVADSPVRVSLGTRMVRERLGVDPYALTGRHTDDEALNALAGLIVSTATRLDFFDEESARSIGHAATDAARTAADPDTHLGLTGTWASLAQRAPGIDTGLARVAELRQTLNAELAAYYRVLAARNHSPGGESVRTATA